jgi:hypothetical protein
VNKARVAKCILTSFAVAGIIAGALTVRGNNKSLTHRGHRIGKLDGQTIQYTPTPEWISDHEAIYLSYHAEGDRFEFSRLDTDTGVSTPVAELNNRYAQELVSNSIPVRFLRYPMHEPPAIAISPALNRLLISPCKSKTFATASWPLGYHVTDLVGSSDIAWTATSPYQLNLYPPLWLSDGKRWINSKFPGTDMCESCIMLKSLD